MGTSSPNALPCGGRQLAFWGPRFRSLGSICEEAGLSLPQQSRLGGCRARRLVAAGQPTECSPSPTSSSSTSGGGTTTLLLMLGSNSIGRSSCQHIRVVRSRCGKDLREELSNLSVGGEGPDSRVRGSDASAARATLLWRGLPNRSQIRLVRRDGVPHLLPQRLVDRRRPPQSVERRGHSRRCCCWWRVGDASRQFSSF